MPASSLQSLWEWRAEKTVHNTVPCSNKSVSYTHLVGLELESLYPENVIAKEANNGFIINLIESIMIVIVIIMLVMGMRAGVLIGSSLIVSIGGTPVSYTHLTVNLIRSFGVFTSCTTPSPALTR